MRDDLNARADEGFLKKTLLIPFLLKRVSDSLKFLSAKERAVLLVFVTVFFVSLGAAVIKVNNIYSVETPDYGGILNEAVVGVPRFINPLLAASDADRDMVKLVYASLFESDGHGGLMPVLAEKHEVAESGLEYTVSLKKGLKWHDGQEIKSGDVVFTIKRAKDLSLNSFQRANWTGVEAEEIDDYTVRFSLKKPYAPFPQNLTLPILPRHIWENTTAEEMVLSNFNIEPVGSGPYKIKKITRNSSGIIISYKLKANKQFALSRPHIDTLNILFFPSEDRILEAMRQGKADGSAYLSPSNIEKLTSFNYPFRIEKMFLPRVFAVFFNSANNAAFENKEARQALSEAVDRDFIVQEVLKGYGTPTLSPLPSKNDGAVPVSEEKSRTEKAKEMLEKNGWKIGAESGVYEKKINKKKIKLAFSISTSNSSDLVKTAEILKKMWEEIGASVEIKIFEIGDLNQTIIRKRNYETLLFGEVVGHDPDPFAFWHSSQRTDPGLNIAMYANSAVDKILEEARTETDSEKRAAKYEEFQKKIKDDQAAVFLYSPSFVYAAPLFLNGFETDAVSAPQERFALINKWFIYKSRIWPVFLK